MIVKNESRLIERCLDSVRPLVQFALIVDTGSDDGTQHIIRRYLARHGLPGEVVEEPWRDFAYNRTFALAALRQHAEIDYALIIDADDRLVLADGFDADRFRADMQADLFDVLIVYGDVTYHRPQICRNRLGFYFKAVLHEYLEGPPGELTRATATGLHIAASTDGARGRNPRKYLDDAATLERALLTETDPFLISRYTFYLAQSYRDSGDKTRSPAALAAYLRRAELGYWAEEIFVSLLEAGKLMAELGRPFDEVIAVLRRASDTVPTRAEALHWAALLCRQQGRFTEAYGFAADGLKIARPDDGLFIESWVYDYALLDEYAISGYWAGAYRESLDASLRLLASDKLPAEMSARVLANARFAAERLPPAPTLGRFGAEGFVDQHALAPGRDRRTRLREAPRVLLAILAKQKAAELPLYLDCVEALDYPKSCIVLYLRTNNNTDGTEAILRAWVARVRHHYAAVEFDARDVDDRVERFGIHEWNPTRFRVLGKIRADSLRRASYHDCAFYFCTDVDIFVRPGTLQALIALNLPIVAPFLRSIVPDELYSNFHAEIDANGYYADSSQYDWILNRWVRGIVEVPVVLGSCLIRADVAADLVYDDGSERHDYVVFSDSARRAGIPQYLDNREVYGYITFRAGNGEPGDAVARAGDLLAAAAAGAPAAGGDVERIRHRAGRFVVERRPSTALPRLTVATVHLPDDVHTAALQELVACVFHGLKQLDQYAVELTDDLDTLTPQSILIGAHLLTPEQSQRIPDATIVYNSEHSGSAWFDDAYVRLLRRTTVWDYSADNSAALRARLGRDVRHVPLGYVPQLSRIRKRADEDIDVLFFGSHAPRREAVLDALRARGLNVHHAFGTYGGDRDALVARAKIVLNIHHYIPGAFEIVRIGYLLANRKAVVSELNADENPEHDLVGGFVGVPYEALADAAFALVHDPARRRALEETGFRRFCARCEAVILRDALGQTEAPARTGADAAAPMQPSLPDAAVGGPAARVSLWRGETAADAAAPAWADGELRGYLRHRDTGGPLAGVPYLEFLRLVAASLRPRSYLEIGTEAGSSLRQFECDALCIDPRFQITQDPLLNRSRTLFFQMTSDDFFANHDPRRFFPDGVDVGFLDGLHHFEALLRDFMNFERCSHENSIALLHDCLPTDLAMTQRAPRWDSWTGDVWRILPALRKYRPDLRILLLDCPPTGLVWCGGLAAGSTILRDNYAEIVGEFSRPALDEFGLLRLRSVFPLVDTRRLAAAGGGVRLLFAPAAWRYLQR